MNIRPLSRQRYWRALRRMLAAVAVAPTVTPAPTTEQTNRYADLYERHAASMSPSTSIGGGDFDYMGRVQLAILVEAGLTPTSSLLDLGCGTGRLAAHAVPYLDGGKYIGSDISPTMLVHATELLTGMFGSVPANARLATQPDETFPTPTPVDMLCAYSVFTHMEHEDTYRYLRAALDVSTPRTTFVTSVLQLDLLDARHIFMGSTDKTVDERWAVVRNVVTTRDMFTEVARLAGWTVTKWFDGDQPACTLADGSPAGLGQSIVVMQPTA